MFIKQNGFTLTELLGALVLNAVILAGLLGLFVANIDHYHRILDSNRLNQQLQDSILLMVNDIRRAGYYANASNDVGSGQNNNPYMTSATDISINSANNCILFTYDKNNSGSLPDISTDYDDERYGYRLIEGTLQSRPRGAPFSCTATKTAWENMTDSNLIRITQFQVTKTEQKISTNSGTQGIIIRSVDITLTGQLKSTTSVTKTITAHIRVRNDKFVP